MELEVKELGDLLHTKLYQANSKITGKIIVLSECIFPLVPCEEYFLLFEKGFFQMFGASYELIQSHQSRIEISSCAFGVANNEIVILVGLRNGAILMVYSKSMKTSEFEGHSNVVTCIKWIKNNRMGSSSEDFTIRLWDLERELMLVVYEGHKAGVLSIDYNWANDSFGSCGRDSYVFLWKTIKNSRKNCKKHNGCFKPHMNYVNSIRFYSEILITIGDDQNLILWRPFRHSSHYCVDVLAKFQVFPSSFFLINPFTSTLAYLSNSNLLEVFCLVSQTSNTFEIPLGISQIHSFYTHSKTPSYLIF